MTMESMFFIIDYSSVTKTFLLFPFGVCVGEQMEGRVTGIEALGQSGGEAGIRRLHIASENI